MKVKNAVAGAAIVGGMAAGALGLSATASAEWAPPPPPMPPAGPHEGAPPEWAPPKPVDPAWAMGMPQVWDDGWQHWGVWMNGVFIPTY